MRLPECSHWRRERALAFPIKVDPDDDDRLYVNNYGGGVFRSLDGAATWEVWSQGYTGAEVHDVAIPAWGAQTVFAMARNVAFRSANLGSTWAGLANDPESLTVAEGRSVAPHPANANLILISDDHQGLVLRTLDGGANWEEVLRHPQTNASDPARRQGFKSLAFAPSDPAVVYAGLAKDRLSVLTTTPAGTVIYKSTTAAEEGLGTRRTSPSLKSSQPSLPRSAVGASRSACDLGWFEHKHQIGKTGQTVSPRLYIACGISGAFQHVSGMRGAQTIVAVNTDRHAPIFQVAHYCIVEDLTTFIPILLDELSEAAG